MENSQRHNWWGLNHVLHKQMLPLQNLVVLDLTIARAGPTAVRLLTDWGANVIKVEAPPQSARPITGTRDGSDDQNLHRNKRSICIDLKTEEGYETFLTLVSQADVLVENFRAPVKHKLRIDYETLRKVNDRMIYASISGFGQSGPYSDRGGVDQIVQGMSGLMSITGHKDQGPVRVGIAISDTTAGMFLGQGILLALLQREQSGKGQWVHTSLLESMLCKLDFQGARYTMLGEVPEQQGNNHPTIFPMGTFKCKDGFVNIAAPSQPMWESFLDAIEDGQLRAKEHYRSSRGRNQHREELKRDIDSALEEFEVDQLVEKLNAVGVPCGPVNSVQEGFENPQSQHLKMTKTASHRRLGDIDLIRSPIVMSANPHEDRFARAAPDPGEHSREILNEFGVAEQKIERLVESGAVRT